MTIKQQGGIFGRNPTFNDVEVEGTLTASGSISVPNDSISGNAIDGGTATLDGLTVDTSTLHVDSANNRVGVGTISPSGTLHAKQNQSATLILENEDALYSGQFRLVTGSDTFYFAVDGTAGGAFGKASSPVIWYSGNQDMIFAVNNGEKLRLTTGGNLKVQNGSGIDFSATSGTGTSELFDDYEEGTWTPVPSSFINYTPTVQVGRYTKVGNLVTASFNMSWTSANAGSNQFVVAGLPFTSSSTTSYTSAAAIGGSDYLTALVQVFAHVQDNTTSIKFFTMNSGLTKSNLLCSSWNASGSTNNIVGTVSYIV